MRSGKSALALRLAADSGRPVTFVATAEAGDDELAARIERHRSERPRGWTTVEEPLELGRVLEAADPDACVVVDCLTFWVANLLGRGDGDDEVARAGAEVAGIAARRPALTIAVSNEVGLGVVPVSELGRRYRDVLGRVNAAWAEAADESAFLVAGRVLRLDPAQELLR